MGVFKNMTNGYAYDVGGGNYKVTGRLTGLLLYEDEGKEVMHLGVSVRESGYDNGQQRFRVRGPERAGLSTDLAALRQHRRLQRQRRPAGSEPRVGQRLRPLDDRRRV